MNAAEHAARAEELLAEAARWDAQPGEFVEEWSKCVEQAKVHAILATIPDVVEFTAELVGEGTKVGGHVVPTPGDRVIRVEERPGRPDLQIITNDTIGTVMHYVGIAEHGERVRVQWDDFPDEPVVLGTDNLRVVLGA